MQSHYCTSVYGALYGKGVRASAYAIIRQQLRCYPDVGLHRENGFEGVVVVRLLEAELN